MRKYEEKGGEGATNERVRYKLGQEENLDDLIIFWAWQCTYSWGHRGFTVLIMRLPGYANEKKNCTTAKVFATFSSILNLF